MWSGEISHKDPTKARVYEQMTVCQRKPRRGEGVFLAEEIALRKVWRQEVVGWESCVYAFHMAVGRGV